MKKSLRIRVLGYLALLLFAAGLLSMRTSMMATTAEARADSSSLIVFFWGVGGLLSVVWFWWSVADWFIRRKAAVTAAAMAQQFGRLVPPPAPAPAPQPAAASTSSSPGSCSACGQPAASLYCTVHRAPLCPACAATHVQATAGPVACLLAGLAATSPAPRGRTVLTSPLGLS